MNTHSTEHHIVIESIEEALSLLIEQKSFLDITISELVKKAGVARSTFYRNYKDKEDIVRVSIRKSIKEFYHQYAPITIEERYEPQYINHVWHYIIKYRNHIKMTYKAGLSYIYLEEITNHLLTIYDNPLTFYDKLRLYGIAGAQYHIIYNLAIHNNQSLETSLLEFKNLIH